MQNDRMTADKRRTYGTGSVYRRSSDGRWVAQIENGWTPKGRRRYSRRVAGTEAAAKVKLREMILERNDADPNLNPRITVKGWLDKWLEIQAHRIRPSSYKTMSQSVDHWIIPVLGRDKLSALNAGHVRKLDQAIRAGGASATTSSNVCHVLRTALKAAVAEGYRVPDSVMAARLPSPSPNKRQAIPVDRAAHLLQIAFSTDSWVIPDPDPDDPDVRKDQIIARRIDGTRWLAGLLLGMRQAEVLGLTWDLVDLDHGMLTVTRQLQRIRDDAPTPDDFDGEHLEGVYYLTPTKTENGVRFLPLVQPMWDAMKVWRERCPSTPWDLVWPNRKGHPINSTEDRRAWRGLQRAAGVCKPSGELYKVHEMRHSTASLLMAANVPAHVVLAIVGHSALSMTMHYSHASTEDTRRALEGVSAQLQIGR